VWCARCDDFHQHGDDNPYGIRHRAAHCRGRHIARDGWGYRFFCLTPEYLELLAAGQDSVSDEVLLGAGISPDQFASWVEALLRWHRAGLSYLPTPAQAMDEKKLRHVYREAMARTRRF